MQSGIIIAICIIATLAVMAYGIRTITIILKTPLPGSEYDKTFGPVTVISSDGTEREDISDCCTLTVMNDTDSVVCAVIEGRFYMLESGASYKGLHCFGHHSILVGERFGKKMTRAGFTLTQDDKIVIKREGDKYIFA